MGVEKSKVEESENLRHTEFSPALRLSTFWLFDRVGGYPLTTATGLSRATLRAMPAPATASTTASTSL